MSNPLPVQSKFNVAGLGARKATHFDIRPTSDQAAAFAALLGITGLKNVRFKGDLRPSGKRDIALDAVLDATFEQPCVVSLVPVFTKISENVRRTFVHGLTPPEGDEVEMPDDESVEPLPAVIDVAEILLESLLLALPEYPKAAEVQLGESVHAEPGIAPLRDSDLRPFAGLASLAERMGQAGASTGDPDQPVPNTPKKAPK